MFGFESTISKNKNTIQQDKFPQNNQSTFKRGRVKEYSPPMI